MTGAILLDDVRESPLCFRPLFLVEEHHQETPAVLEVHLEAEWVLVMALA